MYIYKIVNQINGKIYVGKTQKTIDERWKRHIADSKYTNTKLYNSMRKYGIDNFRVIVVEDVGEVTREDLNLREQYWIEAIQPEYNMTVGGDGGRINDQTGKRWKVKDTSKMRGKKTVTEKVEQGWLKNSGANNYQSIYRIHTPWGLFDTWTEGIARAKELSILGRRDVITDPSTLRKYCMTDVMLSREGRRTFPAWRGKSTRSLGFFIEGKYEQN